MCLPKFGNVKYVFHYKNDHRGVADFSTERVECPLKQFGIQGVPKLQGKLQVCEFLTPKEVQVSYRFAILVFAFG